MANRAAAVNIARDLCLKLMERRALAPDQLAGALSLLAVSAENALAEIEDGNGLWLLRLARDITLKMIERNHLAGFQAASAALAENARMLASVAARLEPSMAVTALNVAKDLSLKMLESGRITKTALPGLFEELALAASGPAEAEK